MQPQLRADKPNQNAIQTENQQKLKPIENLEQRANVEAGKADLSFVVHWDLNKNRGENRVPELQIIFQGLPFVSILRLPAKEFGSTNDHRHVHLLHEENHRHCQAQKQGDFKQWDNQWRLHQPPNLQQLLAHLILSNQKRLGQNRNGPKPAH